MKNILPVLSIAILGFITSCQTSTTKTSNQSLSTAYIDSLHLRTNKIDIAFYSDFNKSSIALSANPIVGKVNIDSVFNFIGNQISNSCLLPSLDPDGTITFYKDDLFLASFEFIIADSCKGFYNGYSSKAKKYELTSLGNQKLSELKLKILGK